MALKTTGDPESYATALRATVADLDPALPVLEVKTMDQLMAAKVAQPRFAMSLIGLFALLAAALAVTGISGVIAYLVNQGRREIGIRLALGARSGQVQAGVVRNGLIVVSLGVVAGLTAAYWLTGLLESELFQITPRDPPAFVAAALTLVGIGALACWIPSLRTSRVDPASVLRAE
jgi:ABC-type antimicrobial peptide transport system permease subunit